MLILGFLGFGVLVSLTPCVLPMIPILSSIIIGQKKITTWHSFLLSLCYVLGMAIALAIVGLVFGSIGGSLQALFQKAWVILLFSLIFIVFALSLFGLFNIQLPEKLRSKIAHASDHQKHGTYFGALIMGCLSTFILSPCVTPPMGFAIGYISISGNYLHGGIALFAMGIGMGLPLLIVGASGGKLLPKAGLWMNAIKNIMGVFMLAVAIWLIERIVSGFIGMLLWAALAILAKTKIM